MVMDGIAVMSTRLIEERAVAVALLVLPPRASLREHLASESRWQRGVIYEPVVGHEVIKGICTMIGHASLINDHIRLHQNTLEVVDSWSQACVGRGAVIGGGLGAVGVDHRGKGDKFSACILHKGLLVECMGESPPTTPAPRAIHVVPASVWAGEGIGAAVWRGADPRHTELAITASQHCALSLQSIVVCCDPAHDVICHRLLVEEESEEANPLHPLQCTGFKRHIKDHVATAV
mmetsp:Transcript_61482/g.146650  ORF Transcript_61482/g.146650 Transcript_61482/m.146650 type:complete len:234 (-) Transcript_61482:612-1313(-)